MHINTNAWIAPDACVKGHVEIESGASVWFQTVIRSEHANIRIGKNTNIQDRCVLHTDAHYDTIVEEGCTIGHGAILHGCHVHKNTLIGMGAIVLNGADIGKNSIVGAGSLVTSGKRFEEGMLIMGSPARAVRSLTEEEIEANRQNAAEYVALAAEYKAGKWA